MSPSSSLPLSNLPIELLCQIVREASRPYLAHTPDFNDPSPRYPTPAEAASALQTLFNLCLTSRLFYNFTVPVLYEEFSFGYNDFTGQHFRPEMGQRTAEFARTMIERRDLAGLVKRAFLHPKLVRAMGEENREATCKLAKKVLQHHVFENEPVDVLFFALMPNLERLVFPGEGWAPRILTLKSVAWVKLKGVEVVKEYGWNFSEEQLLEEYMRVMDGGCYAIPMDDDDDDL